MKTISLENYQVTDIEGKPVEGKLYDVKGSLIAILFLPSLNLNTKQLLSNEETRKKIESSIGSVELTDEEYAELVRAIDLLDNLKWNDIQFVHRVLDAK